VYYGTINIINIEHFKNLYQELILVPMIRKVG